MVVKKVQKEWAVLLTRINPHNKHLFNARGKYIFRMNQ